MSVWSLYAGALKKEELNKKKQVFGNETMSCRKPAFSFILPFYLKHLHSKVKDDIIR